MFSRLMPNGRRRVGPLILVVAAALVAASTAVAASPSAHAIRSSHRYAEESGTLVSPPPPGQPNRANGNTKHTTRLWGSNPFQEAVAVTQLVYPAEGPTGLDTSYPDDRPRALTLVTPDEELTAITATPLIHFPDNAPVLYVTHDGIPAVTLREIQRLKPVGIGRYNDVQAFV